MATSEVMLVRGMALSSHFSHFLLIQPFQDIGLRGIFKREYNKKSCWGFRRAQNFLLTVAP